MNNTIILYHGSNKIIKSLCMVQENVTMITEADFIVHRIF